MLGYFSRPLIAISLVLGGAFGWDWYRQSLSTNQLSQLEERIGKIRAVGLLTTASQDITTSIQKDYKGIQIPGTQYEIPMSQSQVKQSITFKVSAGVDLSQVQRSITSNDGVSEVVIKLPPVQITAVEQDYQTSQVQIQKGFLSPSNPDQELYQLVQVEKERIAKEACDRMSKPAIENALRVIGSIFGESTQVKIEPPTQQCITE